MLVNDFSSGPAWWGEHKSVMKSITGSGEAGFGIRAQATVASRTATERHRFGIRAHGTTGYPLASTQSSRSSIELQRHSPKLDLISLIGAPRRRTIVCCPRDIHHISLIPHHIMATPLRRSARTRTVSPPSRSSQKGSALDAVSAPKNSSKKYDEGSNWTEGGVGQGSLFMPLLLVFGPLSMQWLAVLTTPEAKHLSAAGVFSGRGGERVGGIRVVWGRAPCDDS